MAVATVQMASCATEPTLTLATQGTLLEQTPTALSGGVALSISNPGTLEIELLEYHYSVAAVGRTWSGRHAGELVLSPGKDRQTVLPIVVLKPAGGWPTGEPPSSVQCSVSGSLVYIGNGVFDETLVELGYRPKASFGGQVLLQRGPVTPTNQPVTGEQAGRSN